MKSSTWLPVLEQLAAGELISGSQLGENLSVSRAAIRRRVEYLNRLVLKSKPVILATVGSSSLYRTLQ